VSAAEVNAAPSGQFLIYRDGADELRVRLDGETIWLTQIQIAELYQISPKTVSEHLRNVVAEGELQPERTIWKFRMVRLETQRQVARTLEHYTVSILAPHPRPLPVPIHFALLNLSAGRGSRSWQVQLPPQNPSPSNPPRTVPSPRRQLGSERNRSDGERVRVRVRGNPNHAAGFGLPKVALCQ
jgi:hypothetical protein